MKATYDDNNNNNNNKNVVNKNNKKVNNNNVNINSAYKRFQSAVSLERLNTKSGHLISYYDYGPKSKDMPPLVCIHGIASNPGIFFKQIVSLAARGYRVLSFSLPIVYDQQVCTNILNECLDQLKLYMTVHIWGCGLGGFIAQLFAVRFPRRIESLILTNTFCDTSYYYNSIGGGFMPVSSITWMPLSILKGMILKDIESGINVNSKKNDSNVMESIDFILDKLELTTNQETLASRITLNSIHTKIGALKAIEHEKISLLDTLDRSAVSLELSNQLCTLYPNCKQAFLKDGGDFPQLSRCDEITMHLLVHLRRWDPKSST
jgi:maspardin